MMSNYAVRLNGIGKQYRIGGQKVKYRTLRDAIVNTATTPMRRASALLRGQAYGAAELKEEIWALKDITFDIMHGDVVGIIGRNGAGKSTLLKVLSRITDPTEGYADIYGRVGALLEVGTGFHQELTGRENIYLNAAILGMHRSEIDRKFDEMVSFAEVEKFIDTPVKHYSSGMKLRLGFAVAAHLEPEILIVDEVLAVGDAAFQRKCLGKMSEVAGEGRTVLFVSHDMRAINRLCTKCVWLKDGMVQQIDETSTVVEQYLAESMAATGIRHINEGTSGVATLTGVGIVSPEDEYISSARVDEDFYVWLKLEVNQTLRSPHIAIDFMAADGTHLFTSVHIDTPSEFKESIPPGNIFTKMKIPANMLNIGTYSITARVAGQTSTSKWRHFVVAYNVFSFSVIEAGSTVLPSPRHGHITPLLDWKVDQHSDQPIPIS